jgi:hypothetical protein
MKRRGMRDEGRGTKDDRRGMTDESGGTKDEINAELFHCIKTAIIMLK